ETWPADANMPPLDDESLARAERRNAPTLIEHLVLIHCDEGPDAAAACAKIVAHLRTIDIEVDVRSLSFDQYCKARVDGAYDLAYCRFDYHDDWFDPHELFAVAAVAESRLTGLLARAATLAEFTAMREVYRRLHREFRESMPFIPLWSPDLHVA